MQAKADRPAMFKLQYRLEVGLLRGGVFEVTPGRRHKQRSVAVQCCSSVVNDEAEPAVARRSDANYTDCAWDYDYIQSSTRNEYLDEWFKIQRDEMKQRVFDMLGCISSDHSVQLELINDLKRLSYCYHKGGMINDVIVDVLSTN